MSPLRDAETIRSRCFITCLCRKNTPVCFSRQPLRHEVDTVLIALIIQCFIVIVGDMAGVSLCLLLNICLNK